MENNKALDMLVRYVTLINERNKLKGKEILDELVPLYLESCKILKENGIQTSKSD